MKTAARLLLVAAACAVGCGRQPTASPRPPSTPAPGSEGRPAPYTYKAPVSGSIHEVNVGKFDLVDGVAFATGAGTVVFASSKPIASPVLADSPCPMTEARFLKILRNASWAEVTLGEQAKSSYFAYGQAFGGSGFDTTGGIEWATQAAYPAEGRIKGTAYHRSDGGFSFELPLLRPRYHEVSEKDRSDGRRADPAAPRPEEAAVTAEYRAVRTAALAGDLKGLLSAQGFGEKAISAIRGLPGIDADLAVFADRFLQPGDPTPGEFTAKPGTAYVRSEGANSKGKKFANFYHFNSCGDRLVLVSIAENPQ